MLTRSPVPTTNASPTGSFFSFHYAPASTSVASSPHHSPRPAAAGPSSRRSRAPSSPASSPGSITSPSTRQLQNQLQNQQQKTPQTRPSRPPKYVGVDAATQYSPMEPVDYYALAPPRKPVVQPRPVEQQQTSDSPATASPARLLGSPPAQLDESRPRTQEKGKGKEKEPVEGLAASTPSAASTSSAIPTAVPAPSLEAQTAQIVLAAVSPVKRRSSQGASESSSSVAATSVVGQTAAGLAKRARPEAAPPKVLPQRYELCAVDDIVVLISNMLSELIEMNDALALKSGHLTRFHSRTAPGISVVDYLHRLAKHATLTPPLLLSMVYYIDRLCLLYPDFTINTLTVHRFLITAATVAAKGLSDSFWNNSTYARVGGVRVQELRLLELEFLYRVDWKIVPNPEVLVAYYRGLVERSSAYVLSSETDSVQTQVAATTLPARAAAPAAEEEEEGEDEDDDDDEDDEDSSDDEEEADDEAMER